MKTNEFTDAISYLLLFVQGLLSLYLWRLYIFFKIGLNILKFVSVLNFQV